MLNLKSVKTQLILYLVLFALFLAVRDKDTAFLRAALIAVAAAVVLEFLILYLKEKKLQITESAVISGLIVGFVISSDNPWWQIALASITAILSKYFIRFKGKHIFNPAAFGIFSILVLFGASTQWKGTYLWYILVPCGIYFAHKIKKLEVVIGYAVVSLLLFSAQALWQRTSLWNILGFYSYFYIFVMVVEPKTTPVKRTAKYIFGVGVAILIFILTEAAVKFDAELFSLLAMNCGVPLLNKLPENSTS
ncbi:MAG: RnfABCDGE type electron transport complex subunit D [Candidatus Omnitrophota bacterium]